MRYWTALVSTQRASLRVLSVVIVAYNTGGCANVGNGCGRPSVIQQCTEYGNGRGRTFAFHLCAVYGYGCGRIVPRDAVRVRTASPGAPRAVGWLSVASGTGLGPRR